MKNEKYLPSCQEPQRTGNLKERRQTKLEKRNKKKPKNKKKKILNFL